MKSYNLLNNYRGVLLLAGVFFLLTSIVFYDASELFIYRVVRIIACLGVLFCSLIIRLDKPFKLFRNFLFFYSLASIAILWYEQPFGASLSIFLQLAAFFSLIIELIRKWSFRKMNFLLVLFFALTLLLNGYLLYNLVIMFKEFTLSNIHYMLLLLYAMSVVLVAFLALVYNHRYSTKVSLICTFSIFSFVFSEIFSAIGYYLPEYTQYILYLSRSFLLLGLSLVVHYLFYDRNATFLFKKKVLR